MASPFPDRLPPKSVLDVGRVIGSTVRPAGIPATQHRFKIPRWVESISLAEGRHQPRRASVVRSCLLNIIQRQITPAQRVIPHDLRVAPGTSISNEHLERQSCKRPHIHGHLLDMIGRPTPRLSKFAQLPNEIAGGEGQLWLESCCKEAELADRVGFPALDFLAGNLHRTR